MAKSTQRRRLADPERLRARIGSQAERLLKNYYRIRRDWRRFNLHMPDGTRLRIRDLFAERRAGTVLKRRRSQVSAGKPPARSAPC